MHSRMAGLTAAAFLVGVLLGTAAPAMGWAASITCGSTYPICVSRDDNLTVPRAVTATTDNSYVGDQYFNTTDDINNSASSVRNAFAANDVTFFTGTSGGGNSYPLDSGQVNNDLGSFGSGWEDQFSSHAKVANDSLC